MKNHYGSRPSEDKGTRKPTKTRKEILSDIIVGISNDKKRLEEEKVLRERYEKFGADGEHQKSIINQGTTDRMRAVLYDPQKYDNPKDQNCYAKGFYENGTKVLFGNIDKLDSDTLKAIGYNDYLSDIYNSEFWIFDRNGKINRTIVSNSSYSEGYMAAIAFGTTPEDYLPKKKKH